MWIKGKGADEAGLRYTSPDDVVRVDFQGNKVSGREDLRPPSESFIHIWLYKMNPSVRSVIHVHPEHAVLLTICDKEILPIYGCYGPGARIAIDGVPTYPRSILIDDDERGKELATCMGEKKVALMKGHGISVVGSSIEDATVRALAMNELCTITYKAYLLGNPTRIPDEEIEEIGEPLDVNRPRGSAGGDAWTRSVWRYHCALAGESEA